MSKVEINKALFNSANHQFSKHLETPNNERIILSGKFGHGKTTFLKQYFNDTESAKYETIHLYPVNYSIASNEDIFEYIKHDILIEIISKGIQFTSLDKSKLTLLPFFIKDNPLKAASTLVKAIPTLGKFFGDSIKEISTFFEDFKTYCETADGEQDEKTIAKNFLKEINNSIGSLYEKNIVTELINSAISSFEKETVLVIDDLDRIDPDHIFRILNVFAAHFDTQNTKKNKFGIDKIILVCDIENIRNIFKAKYGSNTDFNGYVDKFYSHKIFSYNIKYGLLEYVHNRLNTSKVELLYGETNNKLVQSYKGLLLGETMLLNNVLKLLVDCNEIDLRNIVKWSSLPIELSPDSSYNNIVSFERKYHYTIMAINLLADIKGSYSSLKKSMQSINLHEPLNADFISHCVDLAYIYTIHLHKGEFKQGRNPKTKFNLPGHTLPVELNLSDKVIALNIHTTVDPPNYNKETFIYLFNKVIDLIDTKQIYIGK